MSILQQFSVKKNSRKNFDEGYDVVCLYDIFLVIIKFYELSIMPKNVLS